MSPVEPASPGHHQRTDGERRRRRTAITLGLVALPVVGSAFVLPAMANAQPAAPVAAALVQSATTDNTATDDAFVQAYLDAGYTYDDALALADRWGTGQDFYRVKVKAGSFLKHGVPLKVSPLADPAAADGFTPDQLVDVFLDNGYTRQDGRLLAEKWDLEVTEAKVRAGTELKTVGTLPFVDPAALTGNPDEKAFTAFFDAGYDYDDATALARYWGLGQPADAKVKAGNLLRTGDTLPAVPGVGR